MIVILLFIALILLYLYWVGYGDIAKKVIEMRFKTHQEKIEAMKKGLYIAPADICGYPNDGKPDPINYCWGYALAVDEGKEKEFMIKDCPDCDCYKR